MNLLTRALLAAVLTIVTAVAVAPAAQAGWMTGSGTPPVWTTAAPCHNGMVWTYGTFQSGAWPPTWPDKPLYDLGLVKMAQWDPIQDPPAPGTTVTMGDYVVPQKLLVLPSWFMLIPPTFYPEDSPGHHRVNHFDFSKRFVFKFKTSQPTGTGMRMLWRNTPTDPYFLRTGTWYQVADCWLLTVAKKSRVLGTLELILAGGGEVAKAETSRLKLKLGNQDVSPVMSYIEDADGDSVRDLVLAFAEKQVPCRPGDAVVLNVTASEPSGC